MLLGAVEGAVNRQPWPDGPLWALTQALLEDPGTLVNRMQSIHALDYKEAMKALRHTLPVEEPGRDGEWVDLAAGWITAILGQDTGLALAFRKAAVGRSRLIVLSSGKAFTTPKNVDDATITVLRRASKSTTPIWLSPLPLITLEQEDARHNWRTTEKTQWVEGESAP